MCPWLSRCVARQCTCTVATSSLTVSVKAVAPRRSATLKFISSNQLGRSITSQPWHHDDRPRKTVCHELERRPREDLTSNTCGGRLIKCKTTASLITTRGATGNQASADKPPVYRGVTPWKRRDHPRPPSAIKTKLSCGVQLDKDVHSTLQEPMSNRLRLQERTPQV